MNISDNKHNIFSCLGIGDVLLSKLYYDSISSKYSKVILNTKLDIAKTYRSNNNSNTYENFIQKLINSLYENDDKISINYNYGGNICQNISGKFTYSHNNLSKYLTKYDDKYFINEPYIVVSTKAVRVDISEYMVNKDHFLNLLENLSKHFKIILIGEKCSSECVEYKILSRSGCIHNIYNDLIKVTNVIDMTIDKDLCIDVDFDNYKKDCYLISRALFSLNLGIGGLFVTSLVLCRTLCMYVINHNHGHIAEMDSISNINSVDVANNYKDFSDKITEIDEIIFGCESIENVIFEKYIRRLYNNMEYIGNINIISDNLDDTDDLAELYISVKNTYKFNIYNLDDKFFTYPLIIFSNNFNFIENTLYKTFYKNNLVISSLELDNFEKIDTFYGFNLYISL